MAQRLGVVLLVSGVLFSGVVPGTNGVLGALPAGAVPGRYSPSEWFPLRRDMSGADIKIGCTYLSRGSQGGYDCAGSHSVWALDFIANTGTSIYSAGADYARNVTGQSGYSGYGNVVVVDHGNNVQSLYAHMSKVLVSAGGAWVDPNSMIGKVGSTGLSSTPHLHFETTSSGRFAAGSRNPGGLKACHGSQLLSYPQAWGLSSWQAIPWGTHSGFSNGTGCAPHPGAAKTPATLVGDPAIRQPLGLLGLNGTRVIYSTHLLANDAAVTGATIQITVPGRQVCSAVTDAAGSAVCVVIYPLFLDPPHGSSYTATFNGDSSHLPAGAVGSAP